MYTSGYTREAMLGVHPRVYTREAMLGVHLPIYTGYTTWVYTSLYTPGIPPPWVHPVHTHGHDSTGVRCVQGVQRVGEEALGSNLRFTLGGRGRETSLPPFLLRSVGNSAQDPLLSPVIKG